MPDEGTAIHPAAFVDPRARLGAGVRVGPGTLIGPDVSLGDGVEIGAHAVLEGRVAIGPRCRIGHGAIIGAEPQDLKYRPDIPTGVRIGEGTVIREYVTIHRATHEGHETLIGARCLLMATCHVAHDCVVGDHVIMINGAALTGHVTVEDRATVGGLSGVHPFTRVGTFAYVGGCSKVTQDVPPYTMVDGVPAVARAVNVVGMRRGGIDSRGRREAQEAFRILYRSGLAAGAALARLRDEFGEGSVGRRIAAFIESSKRGIVSGAVMAGEPDGADLPERVL
jgi:UDP-N-acetylglucosamine acyltransferase